MSAHYKKVFKNIPNRQFLTVIAFEMFPKTDIGFTAEVSIDDDEDDESPIVKFIDATADHFNDQFGINIAFDATEWDGLIQVINPLPLPNVRSKKKRTQKHAKLVALSNINRFITKTKY